jgi:hypothetical protein
LLGDGEEQSGAKSNADIIGLGLCIKGGKPEKGGKIWHFFVNFIYKKTRLYNQDPIIYYNQNFG